MLLLLLLLMLMTILLLVPFLLLLLMLFMLLLPILVYRFTVGDITAGKAHRRRRRRCYCHAVDAATIDAIYLLSVQAALSLHQFDGPGYSHSIDSKKIRTQFLKNTIAFVLSLLSGPYKSEMEIVRYM